MIGERFGRLVVAERALDRGKRQRPAWRCVCDCGGEKIALQAHLRAGRTQSCGCIVRENNIERGRSTVPGYGGAHSRVRIIRGPASGHPCVACGGSATEWSYRGGAVQELTEEGFHRGKPITLRYSGDPDDYDPMCRSCHVRFDMLQTSSRVGRPPLDFNSKKIGHWTVKEKSGSIKSGAVIWRCMCCCGREGTATSTQLKNGWSRSCKQPHAMACNCGGRL